MSTKMIILFITYEGPNNVTQITLKEEACSLFLFSILLFGAVSNRFLQLFWIFQTVNCPQLYLLSASCNFFIKNYYNSCYMSKVVCFFFFSHRKHPILCRNRPGIRKRLCDCSNLFLHQQSKKLVSSPPSSHVFSYTNATTELSSVFVFHALWLSTTLYPDYRLRGLRVLDAFRVLLFNSPCS